MSHNLSRKMSGTNRISELHDSLLTHILSFLPTKEAVRTCLLSKRWRNVWALVSILDFDFADFWSWDMFSGSEYTTFVSVRSEYHGKFVRFIDFVLASLQLQHVDRFRLVWKYPVLDYHYCGRPVRRWILHILQKRPRMLSIYVEPSVAEVQPSVADVDVPDQAFTCSSLEEMKLHFNNYCYTEVLKPAAVSLPNLRKLNLGYFTIEADFMNKLLLGCPNLVELELYACVLKLSQISCGNLKSLVISGCCHSAEIRVSIPSLHYLHVTVMSCQSVGFVFENMSSLVKACVCFLTTAYLETKFFNSDSKILNGLLGVTNLDIVLYGSDAKDMLEHVLENFPYFENLKAMHFESFNSYLYGCIGMIDHLVQHSPVLEGLTFYRCKDEFDEIELLEELMKVVADCGNCRLVESREGCTYGSLDELKEMMLEGMLRFEEMRMEEAAEEDEDEEDVGGGEALLEEEEWGEVEAGLEEDEEQPEVGEGEEEEDEDK